MGVMVSDVEIFGALKEKNASTFKNVCTLGRLQCYLEPADHSPYKTSAKHARPITSKIENELKQNNGYCEPLFRSLGAKTIDSLDISDYEGATILHDLCKKLPEQYKNRFSFVFDGGSLEHVFQFPLAIKSVMEMVKIGGTLMLTTPANNQLGHGLYQFSPELFYSLLSPKNGYSNTAVYVKYRDVWYKTRDPREINERAQLRHALSGDGKSYSLHVVSTKIGEVPQNLQVYQSDYETTWSKAKDNLDKINDQDNPERSIKNYILPVWKALPGSLRKSILSTLGRSAEQREIQKYLVPHQDPSGKILL